MTTDTGGHGMAPKHIVVAPRTVTLKGNNAPEYVKQRNACKRCNDQTTNTEFRPLPPTRRPRAYDALDNPKQGHPQLAAKRPSYKRMSLGCEST
jgi:hypothetical protein